MITINIIQMKNYKDMTPVEKIIDGITFLMNACDDPIAKIAYSMALEVAKLQLGK